MTTPIIESNSLKDFDFPLRTMYYVFYNNNNKLSVFSLFNT